MQTAALRSCAEQHANHFNSYHKKVCAKASLKLIQMNAILCGTFVYEREKIHEKIKMQAKLFAHKN